MEQLVSIVGGCLHGDDAGGVLGGKAVEDSGKEFEGYALGQQRLKELTMGGLDDVIITLNIATSFSRLFNVGTGLADNRRAARDPFGVER